jgi:hypothetical protein
MGLFQSKTNDGKYHVCTRHYLSGSVLETCTESRIRLNEAKDLVDELNAVHGMKAWTSAHRRGWLHGLIPFGVVYDDMYLETHQWAKKERINLNATLALIDRNIAEHNQKEAEKKVSSI